MIEISKETIERLKKISPEMYEAMQQTIQAIDKANRTTTIYIRLKREKYKDYQAIYQAEKEKDEAFIEAKAAAEKFEKMVKILKVVMSCYLNNQQNGLNKM